MPDKKISELVNLTSLATDDEFVVVDKDANATKRITATNLSKFPSGVTVPDASTIGSASDPDAITISSTGDVSINGSPASKSPFTTNSNVADFRYITASNTNASGGSGFGASTTNVFTTLRSNDFSDIGEVGTTTSHPLIFTTASNERMRIDSSGNVGIGTSSPSAPVHIDSQRRGDPETTGSTTTVTTLRVEGVSNGVLDMGEWSLTYPGAYWMQVRDKTSLGVEYHLGLQPNGGETRVGGMTDRGAYNLQCNGTGVWGQGAYVNGSDKRMKKNITELSDGLNIVNQLRPVTYQYREEFSKDQNTQPGFIAQDLQQTLDGKDYRDGVVPAGPEYLNVAYQNLIPILTKAIQELSARVEELEGK